MGRPVEEDRAAVESGSDGHCVGGHSSSVGDNHFQPLALLSREAGVVVGVDLGTSTFLLAIHTSTAVAENFATADARFEGDPEVGVALGRSPQSSTPSGSKSRSPWPRLPTRWSIRPVILEWPARWRGRGGWGLATRSLEILEECIDRIAGATGGVGVDHLIR